MTAIFEEKKKFITDWLPQWSMGPLVFIICAAALLAAFHNGKSVSEGLGLVVALFFAVVYHVGCLLTRRAVLDEVRKWHNQWEAAYKNSDVAAADYLALFVAMPLNGSECLPPWHHVWEFSGLRYLAGQVKKAAEEQKNVQLDPRKTATEEEDAKRAFDLASAKFHDIRRKLTERGSEYARLLNRWSDALK